MLEIPSTGVILAVPSNALSQHMEKCEIHMRIIPRKMLNEQVASFSLNSATVVELLPAGLSFQRPVRLSLPHCLVLQQTRERKARI
ncbi:hypothetical protein HOLleu_24821 [Holothuria leucospilota]|uniref:ZU5 domain-containing protein n=1 Tax=Holothuria leucospilota TaxID=206669 RepID=A0A9Q1BRY9_HOLLE|nr:hypothetical protein HOLleu_24821 [Holothuria leucospilota]